MTYTGDVSKGGPADVRELTELTISKLEVGDFGNNAYLLRCNETGDGLLIDAAAEPDRLRELIGDLPISKIVTTHRHKDHWMGLTELARSTGATVVAHTLDAPELPVPVGLEVELPERLPPTAEAAAYFLVCEALANTAKHARASSASVAVHRVSGGVVVEIDDDGVGGADTAGGSGLRGLADRVEALDGSLRVTSRTGAGTHLRAEIPCG